jgi:lysophospholipase L1-like esterase
MKTVLCFGDSLTWGSRPDGGGRHAYADRWPNVLRAGLENVEVIADGLRGRTTTMDQHASPANMNGAALLPSALHAHGPVDLVIIALGANDIYWGYPLNRALRGLEHLVELVRHHPIRVPGAAAPQVLLVLPQPLVPCDDPHVTPEQIDRFHQFIAFAKTRAAAIDAPCFETGQVAQSSPLDGIHLDAENTRALGAALAPVVRDMLA